MKWIDGGMSFLAETGSNHAFVMGGAPEADGRNLAQRPMEMLLAGTGGCTEFDVVEILKKGHHAITGCEVSLQAERAKTEPKVFARIHFHFRISGKQLKPGAVNIIKRQVLLSFEHARQDGLNHPRSGDRRRLTRLRQ